MASATARHERSWPRHSDQAQGRSAHSSGSPTHQSRARTRQHARSSILPASECRHYDGRHRRHSVRHACMYYGGAHQPRGLTVHTTDHHSGRRSSPTGNGHERHTTSNMNRPGSNWSLLANAASKYRRVKAPTGDGPSRRHRPMVRVDNRFLSSRPWHRCSSSHPPIHTSMMMVPSKTYCLY
jgi:hypothetical protein